MALKNRHEDWDEIYGTRRPTKEEDAYYAEQRRKGMESYAAAKAILQEALPAMQEICEINYRSSMGLNLSFNCNGWHSISFERGQSAQDMIEAFQNAVNQYRPLPSGKSRPIKRKR